MSRCYSTAVPRQLHAILPSPNGTYACLTLYDECPHTSHSTASSQSRHSHLHCDLPPLPSTPRPRIIESTNKDGMRGIKTTRSSLSTIPSRQSTQPLSFLDKKAHDVYDSTCETIVSTQHPKEKAMAAYLAPLVMSRHSPMMHQIREPTADALRARTESAVPLRSILKPGMSTVYLLTFSTDHTPTTRDFARLLNKHLPRGASFRYTIDARPFLAPPRQVQELYSGVAEVTQDAVLQDRGARREIEHAVGELTNFILGKGGETAIAVCCTAGTHRSVAIAEAIATGVRREVRGMGEGVQVKVVVRHVHRVKGPKDPY